MSRRSGRWCGVRTRFASCNVAARPLPCFFQIGRGAPEWPEPRSYRKKLSPEGSGVGTMILIATDVSAMIAGGSTSRSLAGRALAESLQAIARR